MTRRPNIVLLDIVLRGIVLRGIILRDIILRGIVLRGIGIAHRGVTIYRGVTVRRGVAVHRGVLDIHNRWMSARKAWGLIITKPFKSVLKRAFKIPFQAFKRGWDCDTIKGVQRRERVFCGVQEKMTVLRTGRAREFTQSSRGMLMKSICG